MNIFYIEDDEMLGEVTKEILSSEGHTIHWIKDRSELPESFDGYDMVISDYEVPGGDFIETREIALRDGMPLLLVSGSRFEDGPPHDNFLSKPFMPDDLLVRVREMMNRVELDRRQKRMEHWRSRAHDTWYSKQVKKLSQQERKIIEGFIEKHGHLDQESYGTLLNRYWVDGRAPKTKNFTLCWELLETTVRLPASSN